MIPARRFVNEESGMTLALALIMIVLIGVMGAGLLTFVNRNMNTVIEENRGQRAFEVADAGSQLESDCIGDSACRTGYDDDGDDGNSDDDLLVGSGRRPDPEQPRR